MPWQPPEYLMMRIWVDGRALWEQDHGTPPELARALAWGAWFALSDSQRAFELSQVPALPVRPCFQVVEGRGGN